MPETPASPPSGRFFTATQRRLVASALTMFAFLAIVAGLVFVFIILSRLLGHFSNVIWPLAVAGILALLLRPLVGLLERRLRLSRVTSVLVLYGVVTIVLLAVGVFYLPSLFDQIGRFFSRVPELYNRAAEAITRVAPDWIRFVEEAKQYPMVERMINSLGEAARSIGASLVPTFKAAGASVAGIGAVLANLAVIPIYLFFFLQSDEEPTRKLPEFLPFLSDSTRDDVVFLAREFVAIIVSFFRGQLLISLIQGVLYSISFGLVGLEFGVIIGFACGLLNIVPYLGTAIGLLMVVPTALFQGDAMLGLSGGPVLLGVCLGIFVLVQMLEAYVLTPRIMGQTTGLHPVTIIIALFFWGTALNGILGMILAIPLTAFLVTAWRLAKRKYFSRPAPIGRLGPREPELSTAG